MKTFFDLHLHPSFKPFLSHPTAELKDNCWTTYNSIIDIIDSQSSLEQMQRGKVNLAVAPIYTLERPFSSSFLLEHVAPAFSPMHREMMHFPTESDNYDRFLAEIKHLELSQSLENDSGRSFNLLKSIKDIDPKKINLILAIEGTHALEKSHTSLLDNLKEIKNSDYRFLYLTLTHLTRFGTCSHAFGMKLIKNNKEFVPGGKGLTDLGKKVIDLAYNDQEGHRIFVDIKHMSLVSRRQFYQYRKEKGYDNIPIIASHMGFSGITSQPQVLKQYIKKKVARKDGLVQVLYEQPRGIGKGGWFLNKKKTHFNPWSINLFDEEIPIILDSGGLIGVSLDQRILGADKVKGEFYSEEEFLELIGARGEDGLSEFDVTKDFEEEREFLGKKREKRINQKKHLRHFCNNILHIVRVAGKPEAWKQICLGSDFDGLINPINNCISTEEYPQLEHDLVIMLHKMIGEARKEDPNVEFHATDMEQHVRDIMYNNAYHFLEQHFV